MACSSIDKFKQIIETLESNKVPYSQLEATALRELEKNFPKDVENVQEYLTKEGTYGIGGFATEASIVANKYVSNQLIGAGEIVEGWTSPKIKAWHDKRMADSRLYKEAYTALSTGFGNEELIKEIKASLFLTGDLPRKLIAQLTTIADESARRTHEILDSEMPALDRRIEQEIKSEKDREKLNEIFGVSGFGNLLDIDGVVERLQKGEPLEDIIAYVRSADEYGTMQDKKSDELLSYYVDRDIKDPTLMNAGTDHGVAALVALKLLQRDNEAGYKLFKKVYKNHNGLYQELFELTSAVKSLNDVVNKNKHNMSVGAAQDVAYNDYDGHNTMEVYDDLHEYHILEEGDEHKSIYTSESTPWQILTLPSEKNLGLAFRKKDSQFQEGLGVNKNRIANGLHLDSKFVEGKFDKNTTEEEKLDWLSTNNIIMTDHGTYSTYRKILNMDEFNGASGKKNIAHTLYRTYVHNLGLIETNSARQFIVDRMTTKGDHGALDALERIIGNNAKVKMDDRKEVPVFLDTDVPWKTIKEKYPKVHKMYKEAKNLSSYGNFNAQVKYVRKDVSDMIVGHRQDSLFSDNSPRIQEWERVYKQLVQMVKLKMVVANPAKLGVDMMSNAGVLMTMDVDAMSAAKRAKEAIQYSDEMSKLEGELVKAKLGLSMAEAVQTQTKGSVHRTSMAQNRVDKALNAIKVHPYYDAIKYGFIQSMGTSMAIKEFDTISGLQHTIDNMVKKVVEDGNGNKTEVHKAIVWWMNAGFNVDGILEAASKISAIEGTSFSQELMDIGKRLKDKKTSEDTVRYLSEFMAAPSSEAVRQGSRVMQLGDAMARWALYQDRVEKGIKEYKDVNKQKPVGGALEKIKDDAAIIALDTFVDYRLNMPAKIKQLSDIGVLLFPSFWMRTQKVIYGLAKNTPLNAGVGFLIADLLGTTGASLMSANIITKGVNGNILHPGVDVLSYETILFTGGF